MIYVIAGEDIVSSRNKLNELLAKKANVVRIDGKKGSVGDLDTALVSDSMFAGEKAVVVENFTKLKPESKVFELAARFEQDKNTDIIFWDEADLGKKKFADVKVFNYSFPKSYFTFLDSYVPGSEKSLELFNEVLKTFEAEQVLYGLIRRVRQMLVLKSNDYPDFSEFSRMQSWQLGRLKQQSSRWSEDELKKAFLQLCELDEKIKTSGLTMPLSNHLDIILLSDLN